MEETYARAIRPIALITERSFAHDLAISVVFLVWGDVAGAATAVGDDGVGHCRYLGFVISIDRKELEVLNELCAI